MTCFLGTTCARRARTPLLMSCIALLSQAATARAEDCDGRRAALQEQVTNALKRSQPELCRELKQVLTSTNECRGELSGLRAVVEGHLSVRCSCPESPVAELQRCEAIAQSPAACDGERERSLVQCIYQMDDLRSCHGITSQRLKATKDGLTKAYGTCATCTATPKKLSASNDLSTCDLVAQERKRRSLLLACPQIEARETAALSEQIQAAHRKLACDDPRLIARLYHEIESLNRQIRDTGTCEAEACKELERQRLFALAAYLELVRIREPGERERAQGLLRGVGLDPSLADVVRKHGADSVRLVGDIFEIERDPAMRDKFINQLRRAKLGDLAHTLERGGADLTSFIDKFLDIPRDEQKRVLWAAQDLRDSHQDYAGKIADHRQFGAWEIWTENQTDSCAQCGVFLSAVQDYFGVTKMTYGKTEAEFDRYLQTRHQSCVRESRDRAKARTPPGDTPCTVLLRVALGRDPNTLGAIGDLYFIDGTRAYADIPHLSVEAAAFAPGGERTAGQDFARNALMQISTIVPSSKVVDKVGTATPSAHCGVRVTYAPDFAPAPIGKGLQLQGNCADPELLESLRRALDESSVGPLSLGPPRPTKKTPRLVLDKQPGSDGLMGCFAQLRDRDDDRLLYAAKANIDRKMECGEAERAEQSHAAGSELGRQLINYYAFSQGAVAPRQEQSSGWYALGFASAPFLHDSRARLGGKIVLTILDGALLAGSIVSFGLAAKYRNDFADGERSSLHAATIALNTSIGLLSGLAVTRASAAIGYALTDKERAQRQ